MKKSFALLALVPFVLFSCQKEVAQNDINTVPEISDGIPTVITCDINQEATRTQYADNQTFGWTYGDQVRMPLVKRNDGGSITACDFFTFKTVCDNGSVSADFARNGDNAGEDLEEYDPNPSGSANTWTNMGYLIYPYDIFKKEQSGDYPVVDLPSSYPYSATAPLNSASGVKVPLIGRKVGATYRFATAVGLIKVTISNVPSSLKTVKLISSNKCIAGKFAISDSDVAYDGSDVIIAHIDNDSDYNSAGTKEITLNVSSIEQGGTYSFYFPVPVGTYPENTLRVEFAGTDGEASFTNVRRIQKPLDITRNVILEIPEITCPSFRLTNSATDPRVEFNCLVKKLYYGFTTNGNFNNASYSSFTNTKYSQWETGANLVGKMSTLSSGKCYFHYILTNDELALGSLESDHVIGYGKIPFYYLASGDAEIAGTYASSGESWTFAASDNCTKGNVKITGESKWSLTGNIYGVYQGESITFDGRYAGFTSSTNHCIIGDWESSSQGSKAIIADIVFSVDGSNLVTSKLGIGYSIIVSSGVITNAYVSSIAFDGDTTWIKQ